MLSLSQGVFLYTKTRLGKTKHAFQKNKIDNLINFVELSMLSLGQGVF